MKYHEVCLPVAGDVISVAVEGYSEPSINKWIQIMIFLS